MCKMETPKRDEIIEYEGEGIIGKFYAAGTRSSRGRVEVQAMLPSGDYYPLGYVMRWRYPGETEWRR